MVLLCSGVTDGGQVCAPTGVARGSRGAMPPPIFRKHSHFVLSFAFRRFDKQNGVIRLKSNILAPQNFLASYATVARRPPG